MEHLTLLDYLALYAQRAPEQKLLGDRQGWLTTTQVLERVEDTAGKLYASGLRSGHWAALRMEQTTQAVIMLLSLQAVGAVAVLTGPRQPVRQALKAAALPKTVKWAIFRKNDWVLEENGRLQPIDQAEKTEFAPHQNPKSPGMVIFTSGSTGKSKAVLLSQSNLIANLLASAPLGGYREDDIALGALPMDHVFGLALLTGAIVLRHSLYLTPGSDLGTVLSTIRDQGITRMNGVPSLYLNMAGKKDQYDLGSLRCGFIGGGPCTKEQFVTIEKELGMTLVPVYGMSECIGISCGCHTDPQDIRASGVGRIYPGNQCRLLKEDGTAASMEEEGEICVTGPQRMIGYCDPIQTAEALDGEGYLHTGDLGFLDEGGILHLTGRKKDIIIRNGVNLSARRIEEALLRIPGVSNAMVVGLPHDSQGEAPWAMVVSTLTEKVILARLYEMLPKNEIPMGIQIVPAMPMTASGKPDKIKGKELLAQWAKALF